MKNLLSKLRTKKLKTGQENSTRHQSLNKTKQLLPYLTIGEAVIFPNTIAPVFISGKNDIKAFESAMNSDKNIIIGYPIDKAKGKTLNNTYKTGTLCHILQVLKLPDGTVRILVEGIQKIQLTSITYNEHYIAEGKLLTKQIPIDTKTTSLIEVVKKVFAEYSQIHGKIPEEVVTTIDRSDTPNKLLGYLLY